MLSLKTLETVDQVIDHWDDILIEAESRNIQAITLTLTQDQLSRVLSFLVHHLEKDGLKLEKNPEKWI